MRVEDMPAGPAMDALVERIVFEHEVVWAMCYTNPEWPGYLVDLDQRSDGVYAAGLRPVWVDHCCCDLSWEPDEKREMGWIGSHLALCYAPVPEYSEDIAAAWQVDKPGWQWEFEEGPSVLTAVLYASDIYYTQVFWNEVKDKAAAYCLTRCQLALMDCGVTEVPDDRKT